MRDVTDKFLQAIIAALPKMPYPIRYVAQQMLAELKARFPNEEEGAILKIVGNLIYYRYINPAVVYDLRVSSSAPQKWLACAGRILTRDDRGRLWAVRASRPPPERPRRLMSSTALSARTSARRSPRYGASPKALSSAWRAARVVAARGAAGEWAARAAAQ